MSIIGFAVAEFLGQGVRNQLQEPRRHQRPVEEPGRDSLSLAGAG